jgi:transcriptional regulator with XRE-family HTH domain
MLPTPEEGLSSLGAFIRAARMARHTNQVDAAKGAGVSRRQLALLEQGGNVSVKFLLKIARYLRLTTLPLDGNVRLVAGGVGLDVNEVMASLDFVRLIVEHIRSVALDAVLPDTEARTLKDTLALKDFIKRHESDTEGTEQLLRTMIQLSDGASFRSMAPVAQARPATNRSVRSKKRSA